MKKANSFSAIIVAALLLATVQSNAANYHWVGNTGNWSDLNHWATTTGGSIHPATLPGLGDNVFFDFNSFTIGGSVVTVNVANITINNFSFVVNTPLPTTLDFGTAVVQCVNFSAGPHYYGHLIQASGADFHCDSLFAVSVSGTFNIINANDIYISNAAIAEANALHSIWGMWSDISTNITKAVVGSDTCTNCALYSRGFHITNAILKGLSFQIIKYENWTTNHNDFDTLQLATPGGTYTFSDSDTVYIHNALLINSQAGDEIHVTNSGSIPFPVTFMCDMSTVCVDYVELENVRGGGATQYYAGANSTDLGNNANWQFTPCVQAPGYYWVGGTGNWNDLNHWATTSGGSIHPASLPDTTTDVFFDANSFTAAGQRVIVNIATISCRDFNWTGALNNPVFELDTVAVTGNVTLMINGSFLLSAGMSWQCGSSTGTCIIRMASGAQGHLVRASGVSFYQTTSFNFGFSFGAGGWTLADDFLQSPQTGIVFQQGTFSTGNFQVNCGDIFVNSPVSLDFGTSVINCAYYNGYANNVTVNGGASTINCTQFSSGAIIGSYHIVHATGIATLRNVHIDELTAKNLIGDFQNYNITIDKAEIGYDTSAFCYINSEGIDFGNAVLRGANFRLMINNNPYNYSFDTLELATPGGVYNFSDSDTVVIHNALIIQSDSANPVTLKTYTGIPNFPCTFMCGFPAVCFDFLNLSYMRGGGTTQYFAGANSTDLGNNTNWQFVPCFAAPNVWPGDANYDLTATNLDILYIGIAFGDTGATRPGASNNWVAQPMADWPIYFYNGVNKKNADCDGNGIVEIADTVAVSLNYGLTHPARFADEENNFSAVDPSLSLNAIPDSVPASAHVHVDINFGTNAVPVDSIYGIAFSVYYDVAVVDTDSINVDFAGSWLGTIGTDMIGFYKSIPTAGRLDFALTRTNMINFLGGIGHLASFDIVIVDNISTITDSPLRLADVTALTFSEYPRQVNTFDDTLFIRPFTGSQEINFEKNFSIYPNPASEAIFVSSHHFEMNAVELFDVAGRRIFSSPATGFRVVLDVSGIADGVYMLRCSTAKGIYNHRVEVNH
jgi:hypothetical protein